MDLHAVAEIVKRDHVLRPVSCMVPSCKTIVQPHNPETVIHTIYPSYPGFPVSPVFTFESEY